MIANEKDKYGLGSLVNFIQNLNPVFLIFSLLVLNCLSFIPHTNEEQYLLYAQQHFNPDWIPGSLMATEFPGTRYLYELLFGWMADYLGFEKTVFIGRVINYLLLAFPLAAVFRELKFSNVQVVLVLQIFILAGQNFFAGEWIFGAMEAKTFAYIFIFWGLFKFLKKEYYWAFGLIIIATYFHILIGGWFAISCFLVLLFQRHPFLEIFKLGLFYGLPLLPFLYYLGTNMLAEVPEQVNEVNLDYIYVYFRNKHHIGLFYTFEFFFQKHFIGVLMTVIVFLTFLRWKKLSDFLVGNSNYQTLKNLMLVMYGIGFVFVGVSLMDKLFFDLSGGFMLKSYPFRMQGLAFLFFVLLSIKFIAQYPKTINSWNKYLPILVLIAFGIAGIRGGMNIRKMINHQTDKSYNEVIDFLNKETPKPATVLVLENKGDELTKGGHRNTFAIDLIRRTGHDNFFHFKYIPSTPSKMYEWYQRMLIIEELESDPSLIKKVKEDYEIDYVFAPKGFELKEKVVFENEEYVVFSLK